MNINEINEIKSSRPGFQMAKVAARLSAPVQRELALPLKYSLVHRNHTEIPPLKIGPLVPKCKMADRTVADGAHVQLG